MVKFLLHRPEAVQALHDLVCCLVLRRLTGISVESLIVQLETGFCGSLLEMEMS
tara:strand:- start:20626 stop:20787 length:162 start_codon:yes stop_codon:yes gene_type:complete